MESVQGRLVPKSEDGRKCIILEMVLSWKKLGLTTAFTCLLKLRSISNIILSWQTLWRGGASGGSQRRNQLHDTGRRPKQLRVERAPWSPQYDNRITHRAEESLTSAEELKYGFPPKKNQWQSCFERQAILERTAGTAPTPLCYSPAWRFHASNKLTVGSWDVGHAVFFSMPFYPTFSFMSFFKLPRPALWVQWLQVIDSTLSVWFVFLKHRLFFKK